MMYLFLSLFSAFLVLNYLDVLSTYKIVKKVGYKGERNPIARWLIKRYGALKGLLILKSIIIFLTPLIFWSYAESPLYLNITLGFINIVYTCVVLNNFRIYNIIIRCCNS